MTISIIITFSILLLLAYVFDITASKTKIPIARRIPSAIVFEVIIIKKI